MAIISFIYPKSLFSDDLLRYSFLARRGKIPLQTQISISSFDQTRNILQLEADWDESVTVHIPYFYHRYGLFYYSTESLKSRCQPYLLLRELARGQLSRITKKRFEWQSLGLKIPINIRRRIRFDLIQMSQLATVDWLNTEFDEKAHSIFLNLIDSSILLLDQFIEQSLIARQAIVQSFPVFTGIRFRYPCSEKTLLQLNNSEFRLLNPNYCWKDIEPQQGQFVWKHLDDAVEKAQSNQWHFVIGPLIRWEKNDLPFWVLKYLEQPELFESYLFRYFDSVLNRYSFCHYWIISCGTAAYLGNLLISQRLEWIETLAQKIRAKNPQAEILIGIKQPWGDFFWKNSEIFPLELGERFIKLKNIDGFFLEMDFDLAQEASLPRDPFELNWLLDQWSYFGKKIHISFSVPSDSCFLNVNDEISFWNQKIQQELVRRYFLSFLTRKSIVAVYWSKLEDLLLKSDNSVHSEDFLQKLNSKLQKDSELLPANQNLDNNETNLFEEATSILPFSFSGLFQTDGSAKSGYYKLMALIRAFLG